MSSDRSYNSVPITREGIYGGGEVLLNFATGKKHQSGEACWCKPFQGLFGYFEDFQGKPDQPVLIHRNYDDEGNALWRKE